MRVGPATMVPSLEARIRLYEIVSEFPGLHFREIQRQARVATGKLEYHLRVLEKAGLIRSMKVENKLRFFRKELAEFDVNFLSLLRQENSRKIVLYIISNPGSRHKDLVSYTGLSPSTMSWYIKKLQARRAVMAEKTGNVTKYYVPDGHQIARLIASFRASFMDKVVDNFLSMWEGL